MRVARGVVMLAPAVVLAGCGGGGGGGGGDQIRASAAEKTSSVGSFKANFTISGAAPRARQRQRRLRHPARRTPPAT